MPSYCVTWEIDIDADTPEEAAKLAQEIQQDPDSTATVFLVRAGRRQYSVDLAKNAGEDPGPDK